VGAAEHVPAWHTNPLAHALPVQHGWVLAQHAAMPVHVPAEQVSPLLQ